MKNRLFSNLFLVIGLFAVAACEPEAPPPAADVSTRGITNGTETNWDIWKGVVALYSQASATAGALCTGTLIAPRVVLTAGHCVFYNSPGEEGVDLISDPSKLNILVGANITTSGIAVAMGEKIVKHPNWTGTLYNPNRVDMALVYLDREIDYLPTYCVRDQAGLVNGTEGRIVGYGLLDDTLQNSAGIHRWGETTVLSFNNREIQIGNPSGTCQGDSGGPLFTLVDGKWRVTGVTSRGTSSNCMPMQGSYSANTVANVQWIKDTLDTWGVGAAAIATCTASDETSPAGTECGRTGETCCGGLNLCFAADETCVFDYPEDGEKTCLERCTVTYCTTLEGYERGLCVEDVERNLNVCSGDFNNRPETSCEDGECGPGTCAYSDILGEEGCYTTGCDAQGNCDDGMVCLWQAGKNGACVEASVTGSGSGDDDVDVDTDGDADADADTDGDADGDDDADGGGDDGSSSSCDARPAPLRASLIVALLSSLID